MPLMFSAEYCWPPARVYRMDGFRPSEPQWLRKQLARMSMAWDWAAVLSSKVTSFRLAVVRALLMSLRAYSRAVFSSDSPRPDVVIGTGVGVTDGVFVAVGIAVKVGEGVSDGVGVTVGEFVGIRVGVTVGSSVGVGVGVVVGAGAAVGLGAGVADGVAKKPSIAS